MGGCVHSNRGFGYLFSSQVDITLTSIEIPAYKTSVHPYIDEEIGKGRGWVSRSPDASLQWQWALILNGLKPKRIREKSKEKKKNAGALIASYDRAAFPKDHNKRPSRAFVIFFTVFIIHVASEQGFGICCCFE